jgi:hypothetical protein
MRFVCNELLEPSVVSALLAATGWRLDSVDDGERRYLALARRDIVRGR